MIYSHLYTFSVFPPIQDQHDHISDAFTVVQNTFSDISYSFSLSPTETYNFPPIKPNIAMSIP